MSNGALFCFGAFDHLHAGHRSFLKTCAGFGKKVLIGLEENPPQVDQSFAARQENLANFLSKEGISFEIVAIKDSLSDIASRQDISFVAISSKDKQAAEEINKERKEHKSSPLTVIEIPSLIAQDSQPLTSERIRRGLIDLEGKPTKTNPLPKTQNKIRSNMLEIFLAEKGPIYGYQLNKKYLLKYGRLSLRLTYYHLSKGVSEGIFKIVEKRKAPGGFSWGGLSERIYYELV